MSEPAHIDEVFSLFLGGVAAKCLSALHDDDDAMLLPSMPALPKNADVATSAELEPPPHVKWAHLAAISVKALGLMDSLPVKSADTKQMLDHISTRAENGVRWMAVASVLLFLGKLTPEDAAWYAASKSDAAGFAAVVERAKELADAASRRSKGADCMFAQGPPEEWFVREFCPHFPGLELSVQRAEKLVVQRSQYAAADSPLRFPYSVAARILRNIGIATLFYSMPTVLLVLAGLMPVEPVPADPAVLEAKMAAVMPGKIAVLLALSLRFLSRVPIILGHEKGRAPRPPHNCTVSIVPEAVVKLLFGDKWMHEHVGADTMPYLRSQCMERELQVPAGSGRKCKNPREVYARAKLHDACIVPWPAFRQILAWYGGGPFVGITILDDNTLPRPRLADAVNYKLIVPHAGFSFEMTTRNLSYTVRDIISACLNCSEASIKSIRQERASNAVTRDQLARSLPPLAAASTAIQSRYERNETRERIGKLVDAQSELDMHAATGAAAAVRDAAVQPSALDGAAAAAAASSDASAVPRTGDKRLDRLVVASRGYKEYDDNLITDLNTDARAAIVRAEIWDMHSFCVYEPYRIVPRRHDPNAHPLDNVALISRMLSFFPPPSSDYEQRPSAGRSMTALLRLRKVSKDFQDAIDNHCPDSWLHVFGSLTVQMFFQRFCSSDFVVPARRKYKPLFILRAWVKHGGLDVNQMTPVHRHFRAASRPLFAAAAAAGCMDVAGVLLDAGCDMYQTYPATADMGDTNALEAAVMYGHAEAVSQIAAWDKDRGSRFPAMSPGLAQKVLGRVELRSIQLRSVLISDPDQIRIQIRPDPFTSIFAALVRGYGRAVFNPDEDFVRSVFENTVRIRCRRYHLRRLRAHPGATTRVVASRSVLLRVP
jgi:hypothetical protein